MYKPGYLFARTPEESKDPFLFWQREDQPFFAAGACHILAEMFRQLHRGEDFEMVFIRPKNGKPGTHVYISYGKWAFDHNGWTLEEELLSTTKKAYGGHHEGWDFDRVIVKEDIETFCRNNNHRQPWQFAYLPWERAYKYIKKFPSSPPSTA